MRAVQALKRSVHLLFSPQLQGATHQQPFVLLEVPKIASCKLITVCRYSREVDFGSFEMHVRESFTCKIASGSESMGDEGSGSR